MRYIRLDECNRAKKTGLFSAIATGDCSAQSFLVLAEHFRVTQAGAEATEQDAVQSGFGLCQAVMDPESLLAAHNHSMLAEVRQVPGDSRLRNAKGLVEMAHAHLLPLAAQEAEEAKTYGVCEGLERPSRFLKFVSAIGYRLHSG